MPQTFNSHVSTGTNPCINKAIHMLLMHEYGTLYTLVPSHYILQQLICLSLLYSKTCLKRPLKDRQNKGL